MLEILFFESGGEEPTPLMDIEDALTADPYVTLEGQSGNSYRPGHWRDPNTGASCTVDIGIPPLEEDPIHPPTAYDGWKPMRIRVQIPVTGPHWQCVEALSFIERLLSRLPQATALDTEDTAHENEQPGPRAWNRPRALASWERLHIAYNQGRSIHRRMPRLTSVCLWRYRRERSAGKLHHPRLFWPEALALLDLDNGAIRSACFWQDPTIDIALPPVDLIIINRGNTTGVIETSVLHELGEPLALDYAGAAAVPASEKTKRLYAEAELRPTSSFKAIDDADWTD